MTAEALLFTLSAIGISETAYLVRQRLKAQAPVCLVGEDCNKVLESRYRTTFLIPNDMLGFVFYMACSTIAALLVVEVQALEFWSIALKALLLAGSIMSLYFVYLQYAVIRAWCFWCLMSACTIWLMGGIIVFKEVLGI